MKENLHKSEEALKNAFENFEVPFEQDSFEQFKGLLDSNVNPTKSLWQKFSLNGIIPSILGIVLVSLFVCYFIADKPGVDQKDISMLSENNELNEAVEDQTKEQPIVEATIQTIETIVDGEAQDNDLIVSENKESKESKIEKNTFQANVSESHDVQGFVKGNNAFELTKSNSETTALNNSVAGLNRESKSQLNNQVSLDKEVANNSTEKNNSITQSLKVKKETSSSSSSSSSSSDVAVLRNEMNIVSVNQIGISLLDLLEDGKENHNPGMIRVMTKKDYYERHFYGELEIGRYIEHNFAADNEFLELKDYQAIHLRLLVGYQFNKNMAIEFAYQPKDEDVKWGPKDNNYSASYGSTVNLISLRLKNRLYIIPEKLSFNTVGGIGVGIGNIFTIENSETDFIYLDPEGLNNMSFQSTWGREAKSYLLFETGVGLNFEINRKWSLGMNAGFTFGNKKITTLDLNYLVNEGDIGEYQVQSQGGFRSINLSVKYRIINF